MQFSIFGKSGKNRPGLNGNNLISFQRNSTKIRQFFCSDIHFFDAGAFDPVQIEYLAVCALD